MLASPPPSDPLHAASAVPPAVPQKRDEAKRQLAELQRARADDEGPLAEREAALDRLKVGAHLEGGLLQPPSCPVGALARYMCERVGRLKAFLRAQARGSGSQRAAAAAQRAPSQARAPAPRLFRLAPPLLHPPCRRPSGSGWTASCARRTRG